MRRLRASRPALLAVNIGPWTANVVEGFRVMGSRSSASRTYSRHHLRNPTCKLWVSIVGAPPTLTKFTKLCQFRGAVQYSSGSNGRSSGGRRKDPSLFYGAGWEGGGGDVPVAVWWDFENCNVPQSIEVYKVGVNIVCGLRLSGFKGPVSISAYGDTVQLSRTTQEALASTGIRLHHVPSGGKDSSDRALLVDLILWTFDHPPPAHLFLISGDRDFSNALHRLRMRNYNILLACPAGTTVSPALLGAATHVWQWNSLVRGDGLLHAICPDGSSGGVSSLRHGGPRPYTPSYSPVSKSDGNGNSSEGVGMPAPQMQSRTAEGNSVPPLRNPDTAPVSPSLSSQKQIPKDTAQASVAPDDGVAESPKAKPVLRRAPKKVLQQFRCLLTSHPKGMMLADLQNYIQEGKLNFEKDFYGHGKIVPFLSSIPEIVQLERVLMKDNKSWSYNIFLSQESPESSRQASEESHTTKNVSVQTPLCRKEKGRTPAGPLTSSQASSGTEVECQGLESQVKHGKLESASSSSLLESVNQGEEKIMLTDGFPQADESATQTLEEKSSKYSQVDTESIILGKNHNEENLRADGLSSESGVNQKTSDLSGKETGRLSFLGSFVDALRDWQSKGTVVEHPSLPQQEYAKLSDKESDVEQVKNHEIRPTSTECDGVQSQLKHSSTSSETVRGEVEFDSPGYAEGISEAASKDRSGGVSREDSSEVLSASQQLLSNDISQGSEIGAKDGVSVRQFSLDHETTQSGGQGSTSDVLLPVIAKDMRPTWKRWLFGPASEEALSTSGMELKESPELNQVSESDLVTPSLGYKQAEVDCELPAESLSTSGTSIPTKSTAVSGRTGRTDDGDEKLLWGHSFVMKSESDVLHAMKISKELEDYVNSAEATFLLSDASDLNEAVNLIRTEGPLQLRCLDSHQISAVVGSLAKAKGIRWESFEEVGSSGGSASDSSKQSEKVLGTGRAGSLSGDAAENLAECRDVVDLESEYQGKEIRTGNGCGSTRQTKAKTQENAAEKPTSESGDQASGQEAFGDQTRPSSMASPTHVDKGDSFAVTSKVNSGSREQYSEASNSDPTSTTFVNGTKHVHPSFEEFGAWFLRVVNSAFKRSARVETVGYDLSMVKPDYEKEFGVRLDPKLYGFSRVQDLVASIPTVRLSRPRVDKCTIHLLRVDAEVQQANRYPDEQLEQIKGSIDTKSEYWPKMYQDCKALVRELVLKNPQGVPGSRLKPLFGSRFSYPLDHKRVGYQKMSDLLRLMPDVVSVSGNLLVPSKEFLKSMREEATAGKRVIQDVELNAESQELQDDELSSEAGGRKGENWSEIDKEANGSSSTEDTNVQVSEDGRLLSDEQPYRPRELKNLSFRGEVLDDLCSSSDDESNSANGTSVDSQADQFLSFDEDVHQKDHGAPLEQTSEQTETILFTRSSRPKDYDFSDEIDEVLLEDNHVEKWLEENRRDTYQEDVIRADPESEDVEEDLDNHLHKDWAAQLVKDDIQDPVQQPNDDHTTYSNGFGIYQGEETLETVGSPGEEQTPVTSLASKKHERFFDRDTSVSDTVSPREELVAVTISVEEQRQEEVNSKSLELMSRLQGKEVPFRLSEESCQVKKSRADSIGESLVTATEESSGKTRTPDSSPRDIDVCCYTPSAESASPVEGRSHDPNAQDITATEDAQDIRNKSGNSVLQGEGGDNSGGSFSGRVAN